MRFTKSEIVVWVLVGSPFFYVATCEHIRANHQEAFDSVKVGDSAEAALKRFGPPSVMERPEKRFTRYADRGCETPCAERWWFENRMMLDIEAWSVSFDADAKVLGKYRWFSP